jgi:hypothetical protein
MKLGEVWHRQHGGASPLWAAEQGRLQPIVVPILPRWPRNSGNPGSLQILMYGPETNRATAGDLPQPQAHFKLQSKNFFDLAHGQSPGWQAILPFLGRLPAIVLSSAACLWKLFWAQAERGSGIGLKLSGFIPESVFTFIPDHCSGSSRNPVRNHPGIGVRLGPDSPLRLSDTALISMAAANRWEPWVWRSV